MRLMAFMIFQYAHWFSSLGALSNDIEDFSISRYIRLVYRFIIFHDAGREKFLDTWPAAWQGLLEAILAASKSCFTNRRHEKLSAT